jgi:hypothetical protein
MLLSNKIEGVSFIRALLNVKNVRQSQRMSERIYRWEGVRQRRVEVDGRWSEVDRCLLMTC